jgi:hypothetical protein
MITGGYNYIQRQYDIPRQCSPIFILLQTVFVTALLFLIAEDLSFSQSPPAIINVFNPQVKIIGSTENKKQDSNYLNVHLKEQDTVFVSAKNKSADLKMIPPEKTRFVTGDSILICGTYVKKIDLRELGVSFFDGNEIDKPVYTPGEGWVHYIMNPNWNGIIILTEKSNLALRLMILTAFSRFWIRKELPSERMRNLFILILSKLLELKKYRVDQRLKLHKTHLQEKKD